MDPQFAPWRHMFFCYESIIKHCWVWPQNAGRKKKDFRSLDSFQVWGKSLSQWLKGTSKTSV